MNNQSNQEKMSFSGAVKSIETELKATFSPSQLVEDYLTNRDWQVKENSNMEYSLQGLNNHIISEVSKNYWLDSLYSREIKSAHLEGDLHIHDLGLLGAYCCGWDLYDLLVHGFTGVRGKTESGPAKHFRVALGQIVNFLYTLQGESAGAQAFSSFDTLLAPFIAYDNLSYAEVKQAIQEFVFNMNIPTRVGFQAPFTNITMDVVPSPLYAQQPVIIGGKPQEKKYRDFAYEMSMINQAFCEVMMAGDYSGKVFTWPIPTYNITKDFDWENKSLDALWHMTSRYGIPYFSNFVNSDLNPEDARSMCCRLRLDNRQLRKRGGGLFGSNPLTGSLGVVTLNLPRAACKSRANKNNFFTHLKKILVIARESLQIKRSVIFDLTKRGLYPYSKFYLRSIFQHQGDYWANHFNTIGILGMHEASLNLLGEPIYSLKGKEFALETLSFLRSHLVEFQKIDGGLYNLEATPGEGTTYRFAKLDSRDFPGAHFQGKKIPYYTNSTHLPVNFTADIFEALTHQDELQVAYTGGTVLHGFIGERIDDPGIVKKLVKKITHQFHLPYFTITPTFSVCPDHGYIAGEYHTCPLGVSK